MVIYICYPIHNQQQSFKVKSKLNKSHLSEIKNFLTHQDWKNVTELRGLTNSNLENNLRSDKDMFKESVSHVAHSQIMKSVFYESFFWG